MATPNLTKLQPAPIRVLRFNLKGKAIPVSVRALADELLLHKTFPGIAFPEPTRSIILEQLKRKSAQA